RHDHGVFVALAVGTLLVLLRMTWAERVKQGLLYAVTVLLLLSPYLVFIQLNGGIAFYFRQASAWAQRDRDRAPVVFPGLFENPDGVSDLARTGNTLERVVATVRDNTVAWLYYVEIMLPVLAILLLLASRDAFRGGRWPQAEAKLGMVAVLALVLVAWLVVAVPKSLVFRAEWAPAAPARIWAARGAVLVASAVAVLVFVAAFGLDF